MKYTTCYEDGGVSGICDFEGGDVAQDLYSALMALQHRGQSGCGAVISEGYKLTHLRCFGHVAQALGGLLPLKGSMGVGNVRYGHHTDSIEDLLPIVTRYLKGTLALSFNGSLENGGNLREELENSGAIFQVGNDAETINHLLSRERTRCASIEEAALKVTRRLSGGYAFVMTSPRKLLAARDSGGHRPLCIGKKGSRYIVASESVALDAIGAKLVRDVMPGELIVLDGGELRSFNAVLAQPAVCMYEYIYFARSDSYIDERSVYDVRYKMGQLLSRTAPVGADVVIGVPSAGLVYALGYAEASGIPFGDGLNRNAYIGRGFGEQLDRERYVAIKLNAVRAAVEGKRVIMVDDSLIRGVTVKRMVGLLKDAGAAEVHVRIAAPAFTRSCKYASFLPLASEIATVSRSAAEICRSAGADSLAFLPLTALNELELRTCNDCFR